MQSILLIHLFNEDAISMSLDSAGFPVIFITGSEAVRRSRESEERNLFYRRCKCMWHVETDLFALAVFMIMLIKEHTLRKEHGDTQSQAFYFVLVFSIISDVIDIISSTAMNYVTNWWLYQIAMTIYVISMPLLAAVWVGYAYVLIHKEWPLRKILKSILYIMIPYVLYALVACTNPFTGLFFHLSKDMEYSRGILFMPVGVGFIMLYSGIGLFVVFWNYKKIKPFSNVMLLTAFFVVTACFIWIQLANPGWLIINASYALVYIWCDITVEEQRRKELYKEINRKNEELEIVARRAETAAHAKSEFLSRMSHDIRTPMNAIIGLTHLAYGENDIQVVREYLHKIDSSSNFLLGLINDILDMSKIENGELTLKEDPFTLEEFQDSINTVIRPLMDEKKINFVFSMGCGLECIRVDRLRYSQIFFNLLSNAAKFTPTGGMVEFTSEPIAEAESGKDGKVGIRYHIKDNGIGMSEEFQEHLYDPFSQERSQLGDKSKGTGLGLPIVKSLVDAMGGTITVKSHLGKGTEFIIELHVSPAESKAEKEISEISEEKLKGAKVLLVEDNDINIYVAQAILEKVECEVTVAKNGQEAIECFSNSEEGYFDAILMDVRMPIMDGIEATRAIRALKRPDASTVPVIAMTADAFDEEKRKTLDAGMNYHLSKPINPPVLYGILSEYIK